MEKLWGEGHEAEAESTLTAQLGNLIRDWSKQGFVFDAAGDSLQEILTDVTGRQVFRDALSQPGLSHVVVAAAPDSGGSVRCNVWLIQRLVTLGLSAIRGNERGTTHFVVSGTSPYKQVRVTYYKGLEDPTKYRGKETDSVDVLTDQEGRFEVALPIAKFGKGRYRAVVYVRNSPEEDYRIAALTGFGRPE